MAEREDRPEENTQSTSQQLSSGQKCFNCVKKGSKCVGSYPFTEKCEPCRKEGRRCYPQDEGQKKPKSVGDKCFPCRKRRKGCDGTYPFAEKCSACQKSSRQCTAEDPEEPEKGLPKHQKCQRCVETRSTCVGEPPFQDKCAACKVNNSKCYAQGIAVPKAIPDEEKCITCKNRRRTCDGKNPCTACITRTQPCSYEDGNETWTYQTDPKKWKIPTSPPGCQECLKYNQTHSRSEVLCDGKFPCNCCLKERNKSQSSNCTYHYENGVSSKWRLEGERAQELRRKEAEHNRNRWRDKQQKRMKSEIKGQNAQNANTAEDESLLPNDTGYKDTTQKDSDHDSHQEEYPDSANDSNRDADDSDAGGDSGTKHPHHHYDQDTSQTDSDSDNDSHNEEYPDSANDSNRDDYDASDAVEDSGNEHPHQHQHHDHEQSRGSAADSPNDQYEWGEPESSTREDPPKQGRGGRGTWRLGRRGRGSWW